MKETTKYLFVFLIIASSLSISYAQADFVMTYNQKRPWYFDYRAKLNVVDYRVGEKWAQEVMQDNELERNHIGQDANFHSNPLLLNGKVLDYSKFSLGSRGTLTVVKGNPKSSDAMPIPFHISLRRNGEIVEEKQMSFMNKQLYQVDLVDIFLFAKPGDVLIVQPARVKDWKAKRILKLMFMEGC